MDGRPSIQHMPKLQGFLIEKKLPRLIEMIDEFIDNGQFKVLQYIGHHSGTIIPKTQNKILKHYEGIICQVK